MVKVVLSFLHPFDAVLAGFGGLLCSFGVFFYFCFGVFFIFSFTQLLCCVLVLVIFSVTYIKSELKLFGDQVV